MSLLEARSMTLVRRLLFGDTLLPQEFTIGLAEPQSEVSVWLHGAGDPLDVTWRHAPACSAPFRICVALDDAARDVNGVSLRFCERDGDKRLLGEIGLRKTEVIAGTENLVLFEATSAANYCLPKRYLLPHYLLHAYSAWRWTGSTELSMSPLESRAAIVGFIRPHPVMLVSVADEGGRNIFPMNVAGDLGPNRFGFALRKSRQTWKQVERSGRIAVSSVPLAQSRFAYGLAPNHLRESIKWSELPFPTRPSCAFGIPVPSFALRVREMEIEHMQPIGSHTFFVARVVRDATLSDEPGVCVIHGFYQSYRARKRGLDLKRSLLEDAINKGRADPVEALVH